jgi:hypothetical protein
MALIRSGQARKPIRVADGLTEKEALALEIRLIAEIGREDLGRGPLLNLTDGGIGLTGAAPKTLAKIAAVNRGRKATPETIAKAMATRAATVAQRRAEALALDIVNAESSIHRRQHRRTRHRQDEHNLAAI